MLYDILLVYDILHKFIIHDIMSLDEIYHMDIIENWEVIFLKDITQSLWYQVSI